MNSVLIINGLGEMEVVPVLAEFTYDAEQFIVVKTARGREPVCMLREAIVKWVGESE